jgi:hypothetical protein
MLVQNTPSVQNTPGKMRKKHAGSKHGRWCKTRPDKCVKQTVDVKYWENIYLLSESDLIELKFEHAAQRTANDLVISGSYATALSKAVLRVSFLGQPLWTAAMDRRRPLTAAFRIGHTVEPTFPPFQIILPLWAHADKRDDDKHFVLFYTVVCNGSPIR